MSDYILSCTSTSDLSKEHYDKRGISIVYYHFSINGEEHLDDLGQSIPFEEFYKRMANDELTKTSQLSVGEYIEYFTPILKQGKDILHVCLSTGLSGDYNSALTAANMLMEKNPERKIVIVDSLGASSGYGLLMDKLADLRDSGYSLDELHFWAEEHKLEVHHWFFSTDLKYYLRGGRITKSSFFFGNMLRICPLLNMDELGHLIPREKYLGVKKVEKAIVEKMKQHAKDGLDYADKVYISMSACQEYAEVVAKGVEEAFPKMKGKVEINWIGTTIGSHTGPGTVALFFWGDKRTN